MKRSGKQMIAFSLCCCFLFINSGVAQAKDKETEPPLYMRELSRLVMETSHDDDFASVTLTVGGAELNADGEAQPTGEDETAAPYVDKDGELQIPVEVFEDIPDVGSGYISEEDAEEQGYAVEYDAETGKVRISEPYGLCRLIVETANGKVGNTYGAVQSLAVSGNRTVLQYADKDATEKAAMQFDRDDTVLNWCPDFLVTADAVSTDYKSWGTARAGADSFMQTLDTENANEVIVAVLDTGVDMEHPFLQGRVLDSGWDFINDDNNPTDDHYHGTHCAGIICDATPENVKILPIKVFNQSGSGTYIILEEAMRYAADSGADVLSMSFGGNDIMQGWRLYTTNGIRYATEKGAICVASAGNDGSSLDEFPVYPAAIPQAITVASTGESELVSYYSNYGSFVDISAPGEDVFSSVPGGKFRKLSGTSMSCPLVAACAALLKTEDNTRTPSEIETILSERAKDRGAPGRDDHYGAGVVWLGEYEPLERVSFLTDSYTMYVRDLKKLSLFYAPQYPSDNTVTYVSSDPSVVEVRNADGYLKALQPGTATVTATTTEGGLQTIVCITVLPAQPLVACMPCTESSVIFQKADHTATCFGGAELGELGYYYGSANKTFYSFYKDADTIETDIAQIVYASEEGCTYYTKTDGTVWRSGCAYLEFVPRRFPHQLFAQDGSALTDVCAVSCVGNLLRTDGTVWLTTDADSSVYRMLYKDDGTPLTNVVSIDGSFFARCADGTCWTWVQGSYIYSWDKMTARQVRDRNDTVIQDVQQAYIHGTRLTGLIQDPQTSFNYHSEYVTLCKTDGSVWAFGTNANGQLTSMTLSESATPVPIFTAEATPLVDVVKLIDRAALRADGTLWVWGGAEGDEYNGWMGIGPFDGETKGYAQQPMIDADTPLDHVKDFWFNGRMFVLREDNTLWWSDSDRDKGYMVPMVLDGEVMVLQSNGEELPKRPVTDISLDVSQRSLQVGEICTLHANVLPENAEKPDVYWKTSNLDVAFADGSGNVYARKAGTAVITAVSLENKSLNARCVVRVENSALRKADMISLPTKRQYHLGEPLDTTGGLLQLTFADGHIRRVPFSEADCTGFDAKGIGEQTVNVQYGRLSVNYTVTVSDSAVAAISMQTLPDKIAYYPGDTFTADGALISVQYDDGTTRVLPLTENMFTVPDLSEVGTYIVDVQYGGVSCSFAVSVAEPEVVCISPDGFLRPVTQGEAVDLTDVKICVYYADGSTQTVAVTESMCDYSTDTVGTQTMTVSFGGCTTSFAFLVTALPRPVAAISMQTLPNVLYYHNMRVIYGSQWSDKTGYPVFTEGGSIFVEYVDGGTEVLPLMDYMCSKIGRPSLTYPTRTVTVEYGGCTTTFDVFYDRMTSANQVSLEVTRLPSKTTFLVGSVIGGGFVQDDFRDGRICLTWEDGTQKEFCMVDNVIIELENEGDNLTPGERTVIVRHGSGKNAVKGSFTVQFVDPYEAGIIYESYFVSKPYKTAYAVGETLDVTGGRVGITRSTDVFYDEGDTRQQIDITPEMCSGYDLSVPGSQSVTVDVGYAQLSYTITVFTITAENLQPEIEVGQVTCIQTDFMPYVEDGREIIWMSSDESIATVDEYGRVTGVAPSEVTITAQVKGSEAAASCTVTVVPRTAERLPGDADGDGEVSLKDAAQMVRYLAGGWNVVIDFKNSDVNGDNKVNLKDVVILRRYLADGWLITLD